MEIEAFNPLVEARRIAEECHLRGVFDAYETFCACADHPHSWKVLAADLTLYLDSDYPEKPHSTQPLTFRSEISFASYLAKLDDAQLGYLASDAVVALFHTTAVFDPSQHLERNPETSCFDLSPWEERQGPPAQKLVRTYLRELQNTDLYLLIDGIRQELYAREYRGHTFPSSYTPYTPCSDSHLAILPHLDLQISLADAAYLKDNVDYIPMKTEEILKSASTLLGRATSRATSFLGSPRHGQIGSTNLSTLVPIIEDGE